MPASPPWRVARPPRDHRANSRRLHGRSTRFPSRFLAASMRPQSAAISWRSQTCQRGSHSSSHRRMAATAYSCRVHGISQSRLSKGVAAESAFHKLRHSASISQSPQVLSITVARGSLQSSCRATSSSVAPVFRGSLFVYTLGVTPTLAARGSPSAPKHPCRSPPRPWRSSRARP